MKDTSFFPYARQSVTAEDIEAVSQALADEMITRGSRVEAFEHAFAEDCGARYAVAFNSGTAALMAAYRAVDLSPHDRILTTPNTFVATVGAAGLRQLTPVFIDIDRATGNLDLDLLALDINKPISRGKTVVVPVHFSGIPVDMQRLNRMIADPDIAVIEDAAQASGSCYSDGQRVGCCAWSDLTTFSFHPAKNMTTGEGGMVTTNDETFWHRLRCFRNNGIVRDSKIPWHYEVREISGNYNLTDFQAALGLSQLSRLEAFATKRRQLVAQYREELKSVPNIRLFSSDFDAHTAFHLFVVQIDFEACGTTRMEVMEKLRNSGIGTQVHFIPVYHHPVFRQQIGDLSPYFPNMEEYYSQALSLPLYYDLTSENVITITKKLKAIL